MWSLPNIVKMNQEAEDKAFRQLIGKQVKYHLDETGIQAACMYCEKPADVSLAWFDIFSDNAKGVVHLCEEHEEYYGSLAEGYFYCAGCDRVMIENYTWELYSHIDDDSELCLNCYREKVLAEPASWIPLTDENINALEFEQVRQAPHILADSQTVPEDLELLDTVTLDDMSGGKVTGFESSRSSPGGGVRELRDLLRIARDQGHQQAVLILDGAYQFAVSIGVYVRPKEWEVHRV